MMLIVTQFETEACRRKFINALRAPSVTTASAATTTSRQTKTTKNKSFIFKTFGCTMTQGTFDAVRAYSIIMGYFFAVALATVKNVGQNSIKTRSSRIVISRSCHIFIP